MNLISKFKCCKHYIFILCYFLSFSALQAQEDLNIQYYRESRSSSFGTFTPIMDTSVLIPLFDTVRVNGTVVTGDTSTGSSSSSLPTSVSGFSGVDMVLIEFLVQRTTGISLQQADALVEFVKQGGILMGSLENSSISSTGISVAEYIAENLYCPSESVDLSLKAITTTGFDPAPGYHPVNGTLLLTGGASSSIPTSTTYDTYSGIPAESAIILGETFSSTDPCGATGVLEFIVPAYPGNSACGVDGFAIMSGEAVIFTSGFTGPSSPYRNNDPIHQSYAQLIYDFLYDPAAMATRLAWASNPANTNATCAPMALSCNITDPGAVAGMCNATNNNLEFSLNLTGTNIGTTYTVSGIAGITPATGTYGTSTMFSILNGSDGTDKMITVTDDTDMSCTRDITITGVATCFSCDSGADGPRFLGLNTTTWMTIGIITGIGIVGSILARKYVF